MCKTHFQKLLPVSIKYLTYQPISFTVSIWRTETYISSTSVLRVGGLASFAGSLLPFLLPLLQLSKACSRYFNIPNNCCNELRICTRFHQFFLPLCCLWHVIEQIHRHFCSYINIKNRIDIRKSKNNWMANISCSKWQTINWQVHPSPILGTDLSMSKPLSQYTRQH